MRTVLIIGASSDIGIDLCRKYLSAGWRIIAQYRNIRPEFTNILCPSIETWEIDFSDTPRLKHDLEKKRNHLMEVDAFVNLAAEVPRYNFGSIDAEHILSILAVNLLPGFLLMQLVGPAMAKRGWGRIVHTSSIGVKFGGGEDTVLYSLSKHCQEFIPRAARSWAANDVFVNVVRVGVTNTRIIQKYTHDELSDRIKMIPAQRLATTVQIAEFLYWLASEKNGYLTGEVIAAAGGE